MRTRYEGLKPPFHPHTLFPELRFLGPALRSTSAGGEVYAGVRQLFQLMGYDREKFGTRAWNPLGWLIHPGDRVVLQPNWVRHYNGNPDAGAGSLDSVVTHSSVYRPLIDYCLKALEMDGEVILADAPQMDCQFDVLESYLGLDELVAFYREEVGFPLEWRDLRDETVVFEDGLVQDRAILDGDPDGYRVVDLGEMSAFEDGHGAPGTGGSNLNKHLLRGADYDEEETIRHHSGGRNEYKISQTVLSADVIINLPKIKTHKKAGVTLAMKNLVGINCNKNYLPHHRAGSTDRGGDEFPGKGLYKRFRSWAIETSRPYLKSGRLRWLLRWLRRIDLATRPRDVVRSGNWHGNDTIWRTIIDLNRILHYTDREGRLNPERPADRRMLSLLEGVVAAERRGPMDGHDRPLGVIALAEDPVAGDLAVCRLIGFDWRRVPKIRAAVTSEFLRFTSVRDPDQVRVLYRDETSGKSGEALLDDFDWNLHLRPHPGWEAAIERVEPESVEVVST